MPMRTPLRPFRVQSDCGSLTPGVVTAFLRPGLALLRLSGVRVCAESGYEFPYNDKQCLSRVTFITFTKDIGHFSRMLLAISGLT